MKIFKPVARKNYFILCVFKKKINIVSYYLLDLVKFTSDFALQRVVTQVKMFPV